MSWDSAVAALSPILRYKLDETTGTAFANSGSLGSTYNGTGHGGLTLNQAKLGAGLPGGCVLFNGSTGYISVPAGALTGLSAITVLAWVKTSSTTSFLEIVSSHASSSTAAFQWRLGSGGTHQEVIIPINPSGNTGDGSGTINNGAAHMGGFTYTSGAKKIYRDGSSEFSNAATGAISGTDGGFDIGAQPLSGPTLFFNGSIQEVLIFDKVLSASDISTLYNAGIAITDTASATLNAVATLSSGRVATRKRSDSLNATATLSASRVRGQRRSTALNAAATLSSRGSTAKLAATHLAATATLASARVRGKIAAATLAAVTTLTPATVRTRQRTAQLGAVATLSSTAPTGKRASATLNAVATLLSAPARPLVAPTAGPFKWGFQMLAPGSALIPVEAGLDFIEWGFVMLQPGDALIGDPA